MKKRENHQENMLHCKNCDGYYDSTLSNCPHCGEDTSSNVASAQSKKLPVTAYGGGFGEAGSILSRVCFMLVLVLLLVAVSVFILWVLRTLSTISASLPANSGTSIIMEDAASSESENADKADESTIKGSADAEGKVEQSDKTEQTDNTLIAPETSPASTEDTDNTKNASDPEEINLPYYDLTLVNRGETYRMIPSFIPYNWAGKVIYSTSDKNIAMVSPDGTITNVGGGECVVTVSAGETKAECIVRCKGEQAKEEGGASSVRSEYMGGNITADPEAIPSDKTDSESDSDTDDTKTQDEKEQATTDQKNTEESDNERPEDSPQSDIQLTYYDITLNDVGDGYTFEPSGGDGSFSWSSANTSVASVSNSGRVIATGVGTTTITCTSGNSSVTVTVRVKNQ